MKNKVLLWNQKSKETKQLNPLRDYILFSVYSKPSAYNHLLKGSELIDFDKTAQIIRSAKHLKNLTMFFETCYESSIKDIISNIIIFAEKYPFVKMIVSYDKDIRNLAPQLVTKLESIFDIIEITNETDIELLKTALVVDILEGGCNGK